MEFLRRIEVSVPPSFFEENEVEQIFSFALHGSLFRVI
jgi:hypothetical protein